MGHQVITLEFGISAIWEDEMLGEGAEARSKKSEQYKRFFRSTIASHGGFDGGAISKNASDVNTTSCSGFAFPLPGWYADGFSQGLAQPIKGTAPRRFQGRLIVGDGFPCGQGGQRGGEVIRDDGALGVEAGEFLDAREHRLTARIARAEDAYVLAEKRSEHECVEGV